MNPLRVLLTGAGSIGRRHAGNLRHLAPGAQLWAVCGSDASRRWAEAEGVGWVASLEEGIAQAQPTLAVVCSESVNHGAELERLMPVVEALYVEKPLVTQPAALAVLARRIATGWHKPSVVGCNLRYLGAVRRLKQACDEGVAGRVCLASLRVGQWLPDWRPGRDWRACYSAHRERGGGVMFDLMHELDAACFLFGEIDQGQAVAGRRSSLGIQADDVAVIALLMRSGLPVQVSLDYLSRMPVREYLVVGDLGTLRLNLPARRLLLEGAEGVRELPTEGSDWDMSGTYLAAMNDLLQAWFGGRPTQYSLVQALHSTRWMLHLEEGAWRSAGAPSA